MLNPDLGGASDWLKENSLAAQPISAHHQYGISVLVTQMSDRLKWRPAKCRLFSQAKKVNSGCILFAFPPSIAKSELGGRQGSNACTIISVKFGTYYFNYKLDVSLLWNEFSQLWTGALISAVCDGNAIYMMTSLVTLQYF